KYANQYNGGGGNALIDGIKGTKDFRTGSWQGYQDTDVVAIVNIGELESVQNVSVNFLQNQNAWIFYPTEVLCYISSDNKNYQLVSNQKIDASKPSDENSIKTVQFNLKNKNAQYVKIVAKKWANYQSGIWAILMMVAVGFLWMKLVCRLQLAVRRCKL